MRQWPPLYRIRPRWLWAVVFWTRDRTDVHDRPHLCWGGWHPGLQFPRYNGEPTRLVAFTTRRLARAYVQRHHAEWMKRADFVRDWRFRVVRVVETVRIEGRS